MQQGWGDGGMQLASFTMASGFREQITVDRVHVPETLQIEEEPEVKVSYFGAYREEIFHAY